jgi:acyl carrier protein
MPACAARLGETREERTSENMEDIKTVLRQFIEQNFVLGTGGLALRDTDSFLDHHVLDSTGFLEVVAYLEETFGIKVEDHEMVPENLDSIANVAAYIGRKRAG